MFASLTAHVTALLPVMATAGIPLSSGVHGHGKPACLD
jgi:di/tricarboxylate transporter